MSEEIQPTQSDKCNKNSSDEPKSEDTADTPQHRHIPTYIETGIVDLIPPMLTTFKKEFTGYFRTPLAYVFLIIFLVISSVLTFQFGRLFERAQADLQPFFSFHPWLYLFLVSAISMKLWSEEKKVGTLELVLTLPVSMFSVVCGKFMAAWCFIGVALILTFPIWITVNYLGDPDNGVIFTSYLGSWMLASAFVAIGSFTSAITNNQVIAFVLSTVIGFCFIMLGFPLITNHLSTWLPSAIVDLTVHTSILYHYQAISRGILSIGDIMYFKIFCLGWLLATTAILEIGKHHPKN